MKDIMKVALTIALICLISFTSYNRGLESGRESGYRRGYDAGVSDMRFECEKEKESFAESSYDAGHSDGYSFGKHEASDNYRYIIENAAEYAEDHTGYDIYDALNTVWAYLDMPDDRDDVPYDLMVETVYHFASYISEKFNLY